jgi:sugar phosphate isomerase/epimerase
MDNLPLISIGFDGYGIEQTLEGLAKTNSKNIILCAIDGFTKHVIPEDMNRDEWQRIRSLVEEQDLNFYGLAGHCNIADDKDMNKMRKRMEFTSFMHGRYMDTNAGHEGEKKNFYKNIREVIELADQMDLVICLETHGDLVNSGPSGHELLKKVSSKRIRIGYDPANVFFYSRGKIDPVEDIKYALDDIGIIHFKGVHYDANRRQWGFPDMSQADFDFDKLFRILEEYRYDRMIAIEVESRIKFEENKGFSEDPIWPQKKIIDAYNTEIAYLVNKLTWL